MIFQLTEAEVSLIRSALSQERYRLCCIRDGAEFAGGLNRSEAWAVEGEIADLLKKLKNPTKMEAQS